MASAMDKLAAALARPFGHPLYYFASTEESLLQEAAAQTRQALLQAGADTEITQIPGPAPNLGEVYTAAGSISFFGTPRIVQLREISPSAMSDKDAAELAALFEDIVNAVLVVTVLYKDKKAAASKKAKALFDAAGKAGLALDIPKPARRDNLAFIHAEAQALGASFAPGAAEALLDAAGEDRALLRSEVAKLAAACNYGLIDEALVRSRATHQIEADVFELLRLISAGQRAPVYQKLGALLALKHEPIAITAALSGSYVDMLRVRLGEESRRGTAEVFRDFAYKGSDYRLKRSKQDAARYSTAALGDAILLLANLDKDLKSSALPDKSILLTAAVAALMQSGSRS